PLTGLPLNRLERSTITSWRWPGVVGLYFLSAIFQSSEARGDVDRLAFRQRHDRLLHVALLADTAAEALQLALANERVDAGDLDAEQRLDCGFDLRLRRLAGDVEDDLVLLGCHGRLLGDDRADDHVVVAKVSHLNRSSSASTAAFDRTSVLRRKMS